MNKSILLLLRGLVLDLSEKNLALARDCKLSDPNYCAHLTASIMWSDYCALLMELEKKL